VANGTFRRDLGDTLILRAVFAAFLVVGCLILARRPGNLIGWIFTAVGLLTMAAGLAEPYAEYAYVTQPGSLPAPMVADWVVGWIWDPTIVLTFVFPLLLFPTGRTLSPRWRPVVWVVAGVSAVYTLLGALRPTLELPDGRTVANPVGVAGVGNVEENTLGAILNGLLLLSLVAAILSLVIRFRRSHGIERQQLKWFTYAGGLVLLVPLSASLLPSLGNTPYVLVIALPIAVGIAILRYRLYEIDRLINRTLVYGLLTVSLGLLYAGAVLVLGQLFGGVAGTRRAGLWPARPWRWRPCSNRPGAASRRWWIGVSTGASTTPPGRSRRSAPACATRSTWTRSQPSCWRWCTRPWNPPRRRCGCDRR
jgi:hypothetical protein